MHTKTKLSIPEIKKLVLHNFKPALTVAIVSIPLSIAISIASGAGPTAGIITGFWATIMAGFLGGSNYNVVGPAGALTSILFGVTAGSIVGITGPWILPVLAVTSGLMILLAYFLKAEKHLRYVPSSVIYGFATGVAVAIAATQMKEAFGMTALKLSGETLKDIYHIFSNITDTDGITFTVFAVSFSFLLLWKKFVKSLPGVLPLTILGILFGFLTRGTSLASHLPTISERYQDIKLSLFAIPSLASFVSAFSNFQIIIAILEISALIAVVAILETLITARIGDQLTSTRFNPSKEVKGLAFANIISGLMGGLPATAVFIRTGLNIRSGATHRVASIIAGTITGLGAILLFPVLKFMPMVVIAAILYMTAVGLIEVHHFKRMWKNNRVDFWIAITVAALILIFDPGIAVAVGSLVALIAFVEKASNGHSELMLNLNGQLVAKTTSNKIDEIKTDYDAVVYSISGFCSYLDAQHHSNRLFALAKNKHLKTIVIRMRDISHFDDDAVESIGYVIRELKKRNITMAISSCSEDLEKQLTADHKDFIGLKENNLFFPKSSIAIQNFA